MNDDIDFFKQQFGNNAVGQLIREKIRDDVDEEEKVAFLLSELAYMDNMLYKQTLEDIYNGISYLVGKGDCTEISSLIDHLLIVGGNAYETARANGGTEMLKPINVWFNQLDEFSAFSEDERAAALNYIKNKGE